MGFKTTKPLKTSKKLILKNKFAFRVISDKNYLLKLFNDIKTNKLLYFSNELQIIESNISELKPRIKV